jgi:RNA polymerase sigma factor (sigma-70 family)
MSQNFSPSSDSSIGKNLSLFNPDVIKSISDTVRFTLMKNASSWVKRGYIDVDDFIQGANLHILNRSTSYDPDHGTPFKSWVCVVARNYTISESKKLKKIITAKTRFDVFEGMDLEDKSILEPFQYSEELSESKDRLAQLTGFLSTLNESDKLLLEMMKDGLSKDEMMEITHKTGGNIDTCKSRLRQKILRYVKTLYR